MKLKNTKGGGTMKGMFERNKRCIAIVLVFVMMIMLTVVPVTANASNADDVNYPDDYVIRNDESGIPDVNLYNGLLSWTDKNNDGIMTVAEAKSVEFLILDVSNINDIRGISFFTNLISLNLRGNNITSLAGMNAKKLTRLNTINLSYNNLVDIDEIKYLPQLVFLNVSHNQLATLPNIRHFTNLRVVMESTDFSYNKLTESEMVNKLPKNLLESCDFEPPGDRLLTNLEFWLLSQTPDITDPSEIQPTETQPNTDPSETQPTETQPNTDPTGTQPTETTPDTQPATGETLPQPTDDPSLEPTETLPETPSATDNDEGNVPETNPAESETQDTTAPPATDKSDNNNGGNSSANNNTSGGSGNSTVGSSAAALNTQGKSAGTVNTGDNYFVYALALTALLSSSFILIKNRIKSKKRYR